MKRRVLHTGEELFDYEGKSYAGFVDMEGEFYYKSIPTTSDRAQLYTKEQLTRARYTLNARIPNADFQPEAYVPDLDDFEYISGLITRYFIQKRNQPITTIMEIGNKHYSQGSFEYGGTFSSSLWRGTHLTWKISGGNEEIEAYNKKEIKRVEKDFPGLSLYLTDLLEYSK